MKWNSIKSFLIVVLLVINAFLAYNVILLYYNNMYVSDERISEVAILLNESDIYVEENAVENKMITEKIYVSDFTGDYYTTALGYLSNEQNFTNYMTVNGMKYAMENGDIIEFKNGFSFSFYANEFGLSYDEAKKIIDATKSDTDGLNFELSAKGKRALESVFLFDNIFDSKNKNYTTDKAVNTPQGYTYVRVIEKYSKINIYNTGVDVLLKDDEIVFCDGIWIFNISNEGYSADYIDQINVLFSEKNRIVALREIGNTVNSNFQNELYLYEDLFSGEQPPEIVDDSAMIDVVEQTFCVYWNMETTKYFLVPGWKVVYTNGYEIVYNAVDGSVYLTTYM